MLINFALECVGTGVSCDKVSTDGHECINLISSSWQERKSGFIAEHFIKPPVNITFSFPCNIQIYKVFVTPYVGQQLSSVVEIYSASQHSRYKDKSKSLRPLGTSTSYKGAKNTGSDFSLTDDDMPLFYQVSKISVPSHGRICFTNPKFYFQTSDFDMTEDTNTCPFKTMLQHYRKEILSSSSHLSVRLVQTQHGSSVAISNVDIWGLPSLSVAPCVKDEVLSKFMSFMRPKPSSTQTSVEPNKARTNHAESITEENQREQELAVPEEFIDPLTCEVMSIPMLLPCGKNVDKSSLDRFSSSEEVYGRVPRDPFTGVVFSNNSQPIPNLALKSRIDQFLFKHRDNKVTSSVARTVNGYSELNFLGKRNRNGERIINGISSLVAPSSNSNSFSSTDNCAHTCSFNDDKVTLSQSTSIKKASQNALQKRSNINDSSSNKTALSSSSSSKRQSSCCKSPSLVEYKSHEHKLRESLTSALTSLLGSSSSKQSTKSVSPTDEFGFFKCSSCKISQSKNDVVYNPPCSHIICRQCLIKHTSLVITCSICGKQCQHEDFIRKHNI